MGRTQRLRIQQRRKAAVSASDEALPSTQLYKYMSNLSWRNSTNLTVRNFADTGRGLCSKTEYFGVGDELIRIPVNCLLTISTLEADIDFKALFNLEKVTKDGSRLPFQSLIAFYLLQQKHLSDANLECRISAYLQSIPTDFTTPYFCTINELQCLPEAILEKTVAQNREIRDSYALLQSIFAEEYCSCCGQHYFNDIYSLGAFKWAYFVVNSRSVYVNSRQFRAAKYYFQPLLTADDTNLALAPFLDLFNHSDAVITTAELVRSKVATMDDYEFVLTLQQVSAVVKPFSQACISYGTLTNFKLLLDYGFILPQNAHDYFEFTLLDIESFIKYERSFNAQSINRNKFKFIRDHNLHDQMFINDEGISHNLHVVMHLLFKEQTHFPNLLNQVAFGAAESLENVQHEVELLLAFKIAEYEGFIGDIEKLPLSRSGVVARDYMKECAQYLQKVANFKDLANKFQSKT